MMNKEVLNVSTLLTDTEQVNRDLAFTLLKNNTSLKQEVTAYFQPLLEAAGKKTLRSLPNIMKKVRKGNYKKLHLILEKLPHLHPQIQRIRLIDEDLGVLPEWLRKLENLETLVLIRCNLKVLPEWVTTFKKLKFLSVCDNPSIILPPTFEQLKNLNTLYLQGNRLEVLPRLDNLSKLTQIYITKGNNFSRAKINQFRQQYRGVF